MKFAWLLNTVLLTWIAVHSVPALQVETRFYPPAGILPDGSRYYGDTRDGVFHGRGKLLWPNGDRYEGGFKAGLMHGDGTWEFASGDILSGMFRQGYAEGPGEYRYVSGDRYRGEFQKNYFHGRGRMEFSSGAFYDGEFSLGNFHGKGELHYVDGQVFSGEFADGDIVRGQHWDRSATIYEGGFRDGLYHGEGILRTGGGDVYEGTFINGSLVRGRHSSPDGSRYEGEFQEYSYHGQGKYTDASGYEYVGGFEYGMYHGQGVMTYIDENGQRQVQEGVWEVGGINDSRDMPKTASTPVADDILYNQIALLDDTSAALREQDPQQIDLYFLGVAGDGGQDVFLKEIRFIREKLHELYSLEGKSALLINHPETKDAHPMATSQSLGEMLNRIAALMDPQEDILMLYLTSHGSETHDLYINDKRVALNDISAASLAAMINTVPIKWRVVMISACYSGGFIPHLENDYTLVMTAARNDRPSFGCGNDSDMTYFGRAFFKEALQPEKSWPQAFADAVQVIKSWEQRDGVEQHSEPQIFVGEKIKEHLRRWQQQ